MMGEKQVYVSLREHFHYVNRDVESVPHRSNMMLSGLVFSNFVFGNVDLVLSRFDPPEKLLHIVSIQMWQQTRPLRTFRLHQLLFISVFQPQPCPHHSFCLVWKTSSSNIQDPEQNPVTWTHIDCWISKSDPEQVWAATNHIIRPRLSGRNLISRH